MKNQPSAIDQKIDDGYLLWDGLPKDSGQISRLTGIKPDTVRNIIHQAMKKLRANCGPLAEYLEE